MIEKYKEQQIKEAADIVDVMSDFVTLKKVGKNYQCLCPFHDDRNMGSFVVHPAKNCYKCFSCEAGGGPVDFLMDYAKLSYPDALRYLAQKYGIDIDDPDREKFKNVKPAKPRDMITIPDGLPARTWPTEWIGYYTNLDKDNLVAYLRSLPWQEHERHRLEKVLLDYHVGHTAFDTEDQFTHEVSHHEWTMWWLLDEKNVLHNCHLMKYNPQGHRDKTTNYNQTWLHARMRYETNHNRFDDDKESASYCMFGQHILNAWPNAKVNIVESEKTAIIMAAVYGNNADQIWMACSGMQNLNRDRLRGIIEAKREIVLYPDRDGVRRWCKKANELQYSPISVNTTAVRDWWQPCDGAKADIADVVLRIINNRKLST